MLGKKCGGAKAKGAFQGGSICLSNRPYYLFEQCSFSQKPFLVLKRIRTFLEPLFSHGTDINFPGSLNLPLEHMLLSRRTLMHRTNRNFPGMYPPLPRPQRTDE